MTLDRDLITFDTQCQNNMQLYHRGISRGNKPGKGVSLIPVFTTEEARSRFHAIERKTKVQIVEIITQGIRTVRENGDIEESLALEKEWDKVKGSYYISISYGVKYVKQSSHKKWI